MNLYSKNNKNDYQGVKTDLCHLFQLCLLFAKGKRINFIPKVNGIN